MLAAREPVVSTGRILPGAKLDLFPDLAKAELVPKKATALTGLILVIWKICSAIFLVWVLAANAVPVEPKPEEPEHPAKIFQLRSK